MIIITFNNFHSEILIIFSGTRQIAPSLRNFGMKRDENTSVLFVKITRGGISNYDPTGITTDLKSCVFLQYLPAVCKGVLEKDIDNKLKQLFDQDKALKAYNKIDLEEVKQCGWYELHVLVYL